MSDKLTRIVYFVQLNHWGTFVRKFLVIAILAAASCVAASAAASHSAKSEKLPCDGDFEITISVAPVDPHPAVVSADEGKMSLKLVVDKDESRSTAARLHTEDTGPFTRKLCGVWQTRYWNILSRLMLENDRPERAKMVCHNIGTVDYRLGKSRKNAKFCLGNAQQDNLTYAFQTFYEGTDLMISR